MRIYVAARLDAAPLARVVMGVLRVRGHVIAYDWTEHGSVAAEGPDRMADVARAELAGVRSADLLIALIPPGEHGRGTHVEIGAALALGIPVWIARHVDAPGGCAFHQLAAGSSLWGEERELSRVAAEAVGGCPLPRLAKMLWAATLIPWSEPLEPVPYLRLPARYARKLSVDSAYAAALPSGEIAVVCYAGPSALMAWLHCGDREMAGLVLKEALSCPAIVLPGMTEGASDGETEGRIQELPVPGQ